MHINKRLTLLLAVSFLVFFSSGNASPEEKIFKRAKEYKAKIPVRVVKKIPLPEGYHEGLYYDGKNLWLCNGEGGNIWIISPRTGDIVSEIKPIGGFTEGITAYGDGTYWLTDWEDKKIYRIRINGKKMSVEYEIDLDPAHPAGVVWTGEKLYMITWTRGMGTQYHLMQLDENEHMFIKMRIKRIHEPAHLAWDGKHLWITSWYNQLVYKVDVETFQIMGSFRSPAPDTTGIAWDGKHFWITGTRADLYQVEIGE